MRRFLYLTIGGCLFIGGLFIAWARTSKPAVKLGAIQGQLAACPDSPNCVSSQAADQIHQVAPLPYQGDAPVSAMQRLQSVIRSMSHTRVVTESDGYLHAECRSAWVGYIDDVECVLDSTNRVIHIRSASRLGYSDLGANRRRVDAIRTAFQKRVP